MVDDCPESWDHWLALSLAAGRAGQGRAGLLARVEVLEGRSLERRDGREQAGAAVGGEGCQEGRPARSSNFGAARVEITGQPMPRALFWQS